MKKIYLLLSTIFTLIATGMYAQTLVWQTAIEQQDVNLRGAPVVMGTVAAFFPSAGKVVVRFDGTCVSDSGDRIVIAASNTSNWSIGTGNEALEVANALQGLRSFAHTQVYSVSAGTDTFYAVAQNYVNESGSGVATILGDLTVEFFPASGAATVIDTATSYSGNLRDSAVVISAEALTIATPGTAVVHFDGQCYSSTGDEIVLAASNTKDWQVNDGNVDIVAASSAFPYSPFTHTRVYDVTAGTTDFYSIGQNYVLTGGTGVASVYSTLSTEFFPENGNVAVYFEGISSPTLNWRDSVLAIDSVTFTAPVAGQALVQFDGLCTSSPGDLIILAAEDTMGFATGNGDVGVSAISNANMDNCFSYSHLYNVSPGSHTFYALVQNGYEILGSGSGYINASLVVKYYHPVNTGIDQEPALNNSFDLYPNPASNYVVLRFNAPQQNSTVQVTDMAGKLISTIQTGNTQSLQLNIPALAAGMYFVKCNGEVKKMIKQ